ncbi:MAG: ABC transporter ATP-binding protein [Clostridia bacterium]|nr:ABC transporter ATP-binding protein [Clostridia bacterium]
MLEFTNVSFSYGKKSVFKEFSFTLADREILAVMGTSGCGKTTLLRLIAGLEKPTRESVIRSTHQKIAYVFQEPRLFPWMTVRNNLRAVLGKDPESDAKIDDVLQKVGLSDAAEQYPDELSGGMKSRVSLARALLVDADLFLLDEPFAALDEELRESLGALLREHIKARGASAVLVTHQASDAKAIADRVMTL